MINEGKAKRQKDEEPFDYSCAVCGKIYPAEQAGAWLYLCCGDPMSEVPRRKFPPPFGT